MKNLKAMSDHRLFIARLSLIFVLIPLFLFTVDKARLYKIHTDIHEKIEMLIRQNASFIWSCSTR